MLARLASWLFLQVVVEEVVAQRELFYTEGDEALVAARKAIAAWSLPRAAERIAAQKRQHEGLDSLQVWVLSSANRPSSRYPIQGCTLAVHMPTPNLGCTMDAYLQGLTVADILHSTSSGNPVDFPNIKPVLISSCYGDEFCSCMPNSTIWYTCINKTHHRSLSLTIFVT